MRTDYKPVRALDRGLDLLLALNRLGRARVAELAREAGIDRTTAYRLLHTLAARDLVVQGAGDGSWVLQSEVRRLSDGYLPADRLVRIAAVELGKMLLKVQWPSDFATFERGAMTIQESTHRFSTLSIHRGTVGRRQPMLATALGRAALAGAGQSERAMMLQLADALPGAEPHRPEEIAELAEDFRRRNYAWAVGQADPDVGAIAVPVRGDDGRVLGAINIVFFRRVVAPIDIAERHLVDLLDCAAAIEARFAAEAAADDGMHVPG